MVCTMNIINKILMSLVALFLASDVYAGLISRDYNGVVGGVTFDNTTNIEWLDLTFTQSMTLSEYQNFIDNNDDGWKLANFAQVSNLFSELGVVSEINSSWGTANDYGAFHLYQSLTDSFKDTVSSMTILGEVMSSSERFYGLRGFYGDTLASAMYQFAMYHTASVGVVSTGNFLSLTNGRESTAFFTYREAMQTPVKMSPIVSTKVPESQTLALLILSILGLGLVRSSKRK